MEQDAIVEIAPSQVGYFGGPGKLLLPCPATVAALIRKVPAHNILTTDLLRRQLARQFNVQGTCPVTTKKALQTIADDAGTEGFSDVVTAALKRLIVDIHLAARRAAIANVRGRGQSGPRWLGPSKSANDPGCVKTR